MHYIAVYDVNEKRVAKALKLFRQYLHWVQNSVFEGELTKSQFLKLKQEMELLLNPEEDKVIFYSLPDEKYLKREEYGLQKDLTDNFV